jgi:hypothetical protein
MNFSHMWSSALTQEIATSDSTKLFTDARRQQAVNNGVLQFVDLTECAVRQSTVTSSHGVREYNLLSTVNVPDGDFLRLSKQGPEFHFTDTASHVQYITGEDFPRRDINWLNQYQPGWRDSTGGTPSAYYERPDGGAYYFGFDTPPAITAGQSAKVLLPYVARPVIMTASTDVPFTFAGLTRTDLEPYHMAGVHYAAYELEKLRGDAQAVQTQWQLFSSYVERFIRACRPKGGRQIRQMRNYFSEARIRRVERSGLIADPWA